MKNSKNKLASTLLLTLFVLAIGILATRASAADSVLGSGDLIRISVSGYPELGVDTRVSQSGNISFPYLGALSVAGRSTSEVEALLAQRLADGAIVRQPQVSVLVIEIQSQLVGVMGQVNKPGQYPLEASHKLIDLLAQAGGVINGASGGTSVNGVGTAGDEATLLRHDGSKVTIDLPALFEGDPAQNLVVVGGDTIYVPRAPQFYVDGEVQRPGVYRLERNMTVSQAISAGGGLTLRGSAHRVLIKRREANGKETERGVRGDDLVKAGDVLVVKESLF